MSQSLINPLEHPPNHVGSAHGSGHHNPCDCDPRPKLVISLPPSHSSKTLYLLAPSRSNQHNNPTINQSVHHPSNTSFHTRLHDAITRARPHHPRRLQLPRNPLPHRNPPPLRPPPQPLLHPQQPSPPPHGRNRPLQRLPHRHRLHPPNLDLHPRTNDDRLPSPCPSSQPRLPKSRRQRRWPLASRHASPQSRRLPCGRGFDVAVVRKLAEAHEDFLWELWH